MFPENRALELIIIAAVALIVVGPKDLPVLLRKVGRAVGKMRAMAAEFRASFDEIARQSELDELRREVEALRTSRTGAAHTQVFDDINQHLNSGFDPNVSFSPAVTPEAAAAQADEVPVPPPAEPAAAEPAPAPKPRARRKPKAAAESPS